MAPGIACFSAGHEYAHGGVSLQECLIPNLRITGRTASATTETNISAVTWVGLRCRVRVDGSEPGMSIDLRTRVGDPASSVSTPQPVADDGSGSLLVADDDLVESPVLVVVLDADGQVIAKRSTIIGGEQ